MTPLSFMNTKFQDFGEFGWIGRLNGSEYWTLDCISFDIMFFASPISYRLLAVNGGQN